MKDALYIVDTEVFGNLIKLYLSKSDSREVFGDDWDDTPYEHNAGVIYDRFVDYTYSIAIDPEYCVTTPADDYSYGGNSPFCKNSFKERSAPAIVIGRMTGWDFIYSEEASSKNNVTIYYYDTLDDTLNSLKDYILKSELKKEKGE